MPRSFLVKKGKHLNDYFNRWVYREPSSPIEGEVAPTPLVSNEVINSINEYNINPKTETGKNKNLFTPFLFHFLLQFCNISFSSTIEQNKRMLM